MDEAIPMRGADLDESANVMRPSCGTMVFPRPAASEAAIKERDASVSNPAKCLCPSRRTGIDINGASNGRQCLSVGWSPSPMCVVDDAQSTTQVGALGQ